jgi:hypothetical protein
MKKFIVTTTINKPTLATLKFCEISNKDNWTFVVVGDSKTPHQDYEALQKKYPKSFIYLHPEFQEKNYKELSDIIGWKSIQRRNIGFIYAYQEGAEIIATVDDDNIPYDDWGKEIFIGQNIEIDLFNHMDYDVFDPISATSHDHCWHRGYPIEYVPNKNRIEYKGKTHRKVLIQADFWDGDPDIDASCRLTKKPILMFEKFKPFGSNQLSPFNSQNTFLHRDVIKYYAVLPHVGRMDDIWGGYIAQHFFKDSVIYNKATVYQDRNVQDLVTNLEKEILGYRQTLPLLQDLENFYNYFPEKTKKFWDIYTNYFK